MNKQGPTVNQRKKELYTGMPVTLPTGLPGCWLRFCKGGNTSSWVLKGGMDGPKVVVDTAAMIKATWRDA